MRIASGVTDQFIYFVAVDLTDLKTRETGLTGFTVRRSRNGGASVAFTTPTINETDSANMPGVYELLLDEDMTIDAGDETQEYCLHIIQASMTPVTRTFELYRPKITVGNTLGVTSDGDVSGTPPQLLQSTTIATLASQTSFTLTVGSADNDAYNLATVVITDSVTSTQKAIGLVSDYIGTSKTVTLSVDPGIFTMAVGDTVEIIANSPNIDVLVSSRTQPEVATNIATLASQVSFTLDSGSPDDDAYNGWTCIITDVTNASQKAVGLISDYTGSTKTVTLEIDPAIFVMAVGDFIQIEAQRVGAETITDGGVEKIADFVWDEILIGATHNIATSAGRRLRDVSSTAISIDTAQAGASNSITLASGEPSTDDIFTSNLISLIGGTGIGQTRVIAEYDGTTKIAIVNRTWEVNPDATSEYAITAFAVRLPVDHGTAQAGTSGSITLEAGASATTDIFKGDLIFISTGTGAGQTRFITAYNGTTKVASISPDWVTTPDATSVYQVFSKASSDVASLGGSAQSLIDLQDFADDGYNPATNKVEGVVLVDTTTVSTDVLARLPAALVGGRMDSSVGAMITDILTADALATDAAEEIADALLDRVAGIETGFTPRQALRLILAALVGKLSGAATTNILIRDVNDTKDRINATVDASGNRSAVTKDTT